MMFQKKIPMKHHQMNNCLYKFNQLPMSFVASAFLVRKCIEFLSYNIGKKKKNKYIFSVLIYRNIAVKTPLKQCF